MERNFAWRERDNDHASPLANILMRKDREGEGGLVPISRHVSDMFLGRKIV